MLLIFLQYGYCEGRPGIGLSRTLFGLGVWVLLAAADVLCLTLDMGFSGSGTACFGDMIRAINPLTAPSICAMQDRTSVADVPQHLREYLSALVQHTTPMSLCRIQRGVDTKSTDVMYIHLHVCLTAFAGGATSTRALSSLHEL
jgi:hypothetical protein